MSSSSKILVTGVQGQLGWSIQNLSANYPQYEFVFVDKDEMDLSKPETIISFVESIQPKYVVHCAAYTAVDKAETDKDLAHKINALSTAEIAKACAKIGAKLIAISTDYVFDGNGKKPYLPDEKTDPINYYGHSKWEGEQAALQYNPSATIIIRTSWVYCEHGHNFVKTMLRLMKEKEELKVVSDQIGSPTYAPDLAAAILSIMDRQLKGELVLAGDYYPIYHFTNSGVISWFDFATAIKEISASNCKVLPTSSADYPTPAKRPAYSVLDKESMIHELGITLKDWRESLNLCVQQLQRN
jgi:dTDP-4-dehydrorhamnose reductase